MAAISVCAIFLLASCRTPTTPQARELYDASLDLLIERTARAQRIGQMVSLSGSGICRSLAPVPGLAVLRAESLEGGLREAAERRFGSRSGIFVTALFEGLPAASAGVRPGDRIVEVEGSKPTLPSWKLLNIGVRAMPPLVLPKVTGSELRLSIIRQGQALELQLPARSGCGSPISLATSDSVNAFAWSDQVVLLSGMMRFMPRDEALALVVGHEIGHIVLGHTKRQASSVDAERDADYIGSYLASRAGFALTTSDWTLLRLAYEDPSQLAEDRTSTHPSGPERQLAFERALAEIARKREAGLELLPEGFE